MGLFASDKSSPWHDKASHFTLIKSLDEKWDTWSVKTNLSHANESWQNPVGYFQISICKWNDKRDLWNVKQIEKSRSKFTIRLAVAHKASQHTRQAQGALISTFSSASPWYEIFVIGKGWLTLLLVDLLQLFTIFCWMPEAKFQY